MEDNAVIKTNRKDTKKALIRALQIMETTDWETPMNSKAINHLLEQKYGMREWAGKPFSTT